MQQKECLVKYSDPPTSAFLGAGLEISTDLLKRLAPEFLEVNGWNKYSGRRVINFFSICVVAPPIGFFVAQGAASYFGIPEVAPLVGLFSVFSGPFSGLALYMRGFRERERLMDRIDASILNCFSDHVIKQDYPGLLWSADQLLDVWNPIRRAPDRALAERLRVYKALLGNSPGLDVLLISPFILFENSGLVGKEKIMPIGVKKLISLTTSMPPFAMSALNLLYQKGASRGSVQRACIESPYLGTDQRKMIMANPETFREHLETRELREWYDAILSFLEKSSSLAPQR